MDDLEIKNKEQSQLLFFNEALEYFNENNIIMNQDLEQQDISNTLSNILREEMLAQMNNLKELLLKHPDIKIEELSDEEKQLFHEFIKNYSICPICKSFNHYYNLRDFFFGKNQDLLTDLLKLMKLKKKKFKKLDVNFGIPCCNCFKQYFQNEK